MMTTVVLQVIMKGLLGSELREQVNLEWNADLVETMKLKNLNGQAAQGLYSGEARHESRRFPGA